MSRDTAPITIHLLLSESHFPQYLSFAAKYTLYFDRFDVVCWNRPLLYGYFHCSPKSISLHFSHVIVISQYLKLVDARISSVIYIYICYSLFACGTVYMSWIKLSYSACCCVNGARFLYVSSWNKYMYTDKMLQDGNKTRLYKVYVVCSDKDWIYYLTVIHNIVLTFTPFQRYPHVLK